MSKINQKVSPKIIQEISNFHWTFIQSNFNLIWKTLFLPGVEMFSLPWLLFKILNKLISFTLTTFFIFIFFLAFYFFKKEKTIKENAFQNKHKMFKRDQKNNWHWNQKILLYFKLYLTFLKEIDKDFPLLKQRFLCKKGSYF